MLYTQCKPSCKTCKYLTSIVQARLAICLQQTCRKLAENLQDLVKCKELALKMVLSLHISCKSLQVSCKIESKIFARISISCKIYACKIRKFCVQDLARTMQDSCTFHARNLSDTCMQLALFLHATCTFLACNLHFSCMQLALFLHATCTFLACNLHFNLVSLPTQKYDKCIGWRENMRLY